MQVTLSYRLFNFINRLDFTENKIIIFKLSNFWDRVTDTLIYVREKLWVSAISTSVHSLARRCVSYKAFRQVMYEEYYQWNTWKFFEKK